EAVALLEKSEKSLPDDYNPPARLARALHNLKRDDQALVAVDRSLTKAYGPRKAGILSLKADILEAQGKGSEAGKVLDEALALYRNLPDGLKPGQGAIDALTARRNKLAAAAGNPAGTAPKTN